MTQERVIRLIKRRPTRVEEWRPISTSDLLQVPSKNRWRRWLQQAAWSLCKWLGCKFDRMFTHETFETSELNFDNLIELIHLTRHEMHLIWNENARTILIGHAEMHKLHCEIDDKMVRFGMPLMLQDGGKMRVFDMDVVLVPWMSGILLVPDLSFEKGGR